MPFLDRSAPLHCSVGWGELGTGGALGYEDKQVSVAGRFFGRSLSTHPPARLLYHLGGSASRFACSVALNDDAAGGGARADFSVLADGSEVALALDVAAGEPPRRLEADVGGAHLLELVVATTSFELCHAVWLDPEVDALPGNGHPEVLLDCLERTEIQLPPIRPRAERCVATVVSGGFEALLDDMLGSLHAHGDCADAVVVVFLLDDGPALERVVAKYRAFPVRCRPLRALNASSKAPLYSISRVVDARQFVCLDADTLVLGELGCVFAALDACPERSVLACREGHEGGGVDLGRALEAYYFGAPGDIGRILGEAGEEPEYGLVVNDGMFAGSALALDRLDASIRAMPGARAWLDERPDLHWRNQFIFNLALAAERCGVEADWTMNVQLHTTDVDVEATEGRMRVRRRGRPVRVLHLNGGGRGKHPELSGVFASVPDPLVGRGEGDGYRAFLHALRPWIGRHGVSSLTWSLYGKTDARSARVRDPSMLPMLALLHYLVRANGCVRALETGTAFGVSAACLASAVAARPGAAIVSFDPYVQPEREELWSLLPGPMRACIDARAEDSLEGMSQALLAGERFHAALLDSVHTEEHLWAEWELARELVCAGGLILVHDGRWVPGVARVLDRISAEGYGVARLLEADDGMSEDAGLGLAVVENRARTKVVAR